MGNSRYEGEIMGMLLYPTITKELDIKYLIKGKPIMVKTINLAGTWDGR
jgi:hypothetical protein